MTEPRNDENLEGIQGLARGLGRLLPGGGTRGEAIAELQARVEAAERALKAIADAPDDVDGYWLRKLARALLIRGRPTKAHTRAMEKIGAARKRTKGGR